MILEPMNMRTFITCASLFIITSCSEDTSSITAEDINTEVEFAAPMMMADDAYSLHSEIQSIAIQKPKSNEVTAQMRPAMFNGEIWTNTEDGIDVVFLMEGFTASQEAKFYEYVNHCIEAMQSTVPFSYNMAHFNFWTYNSVSEEQGISIQSHESNPLTPVTKNTYWGVYRNEIGLSRYTNMPKKRYKAMETLLLHPKTGYFNGDVYPVIIVNDPVYAGSGDFKRGNKRLANAICTTSEQFSVSTFKALFLHEFGHSFGDLDDEYTHQPTFDRIFKYDKPLMNLKRKHNTSEDDVKDRKWDDLVSNPQYIKGSRWGTEEYRSSPNSLMRSVVLGKPFGELNELLLQRRIDEAIGQ